MSGDLSQAQRNTNLNNFKSGRVNVLIATDVASRGLDLQDVTYVINYDFPINIKTYIHRIGRTGRAGKQGISVAYLDG
jgi:superfamily II DNA/RNA helicase